MADLRLRLEFEARIGSRHVYIRQWFQPSSEVSTIDHLAQQIKKQFKLSEKNITLHLRGFALTPDGPLTFLRDGDILVVAADKKLELAGSTLDLRLTSHVVGDLLRDSDDIAHPLALTLGSGKLKPQLTGAKKAKRRKIVPATESQQQKLLVSNAGLEQDAFQQDSSEPSEDTASSEEESSEEESSEADEQMTPQPIQAEVHPAKKMGADGRPLPSRNARRKKLKRKLIREGVLPKPPSKQSKLQAMDTLEQLTAVVVPDDRLPKRGEAHAPNSEYAEFLATGHVRFVDSDEEYGSPPIQHSTRHASPRRDGPQHGLPLPTDGICNRGDEAQPAHYINKAVIERNATLQQSTEPEIEMDGSTGQAGMPAYALTSRVDIDYEALPVIKELPGPGSVIAYKILELDLNMCPVVTDWRCGKVVESLEESQTLKAEPWPVGSQHPGLQPENPELASDEDADEDSHVPMSEVYDSTGLLTAHLTQLLEVRLVAGPKVALDTQMMEPSRQTPAMQPAQSHQEEQTPSRPQTLSDRILTPGSPKESISMPSNRHGDRSSALQARTALPMLPRVLQQPGTHDPSPAGLSRSTPRIRPIPRMRRNSAPGCPTASAPPLTAPTKLDGLYDEGNSSDRLPSRLSNTQLPDSPERMVPLPAVSPDIAELQEALSKRRQELMQGSTSAGLGNPQAIINELGSRVQRDSSSSGQNHGFEGGTGGPGAVKPRPGVKSKALGAFLQRLRQNGMSESLDASVS